jgi:hypothetical protein
MNATTFLQDRFDAVSKLYTASRDVLGAAHPATIAILPELRATRREAEGAHIEARCQSPSGPDCPICSSFRRKATEARAAADRHPLLPVIRTTS